MFKYNNKMDAVFFGKGYITVLYCAIYLNNSQRLFCEIVCSSQCLYFF